MRRYYHIALGIGLVACAAFAAWPINPRPIETPPIERIDSAPTRVIALDIAAFRTPIWIAEPAPPAPPTPVPAPPPPPPLRLQLLAIVRESGPEGSSVYKAAVYDPDSDRIRVVAAGEHLGTRMVEQVDEGTLTLRDHAGTRVLALKDGGTP